MTKVVEQHCVFQCGVGPVLIHMYPNFIFNLELLTGYGFNVCTFWLRNL